MIIQSSRSIGTYNYLILNIDNDRRSKNKMLEIHKYLSTHINILQLYKVLIFKKMHLKREI